MPQRDAAGGSASLSESIGDFSPVGYAPLFILAMVLASGAYLLFYPARRNQAAIHLWCFAKVHAEAYRLSLEASNASRQVDVQLVHSDAINRRLRAAMMTDLDVPDAVEIEITHAGSFFRGPVEKVGFRDLTPWLMAGEPGRRLYDRFVTSRFTPYTNRGRIFGMPHDVHPVMLAYRADYFERLGIDAAALDTWDRFVAKAREVVVRTGDKPLYMVGFEDATGTSLEVLLYQRGGGYFNAAGELTMDDEVALATLLWFTPLIAGPRRIASDPGWQAAFARNFGGTSDDDRPYVLSVICPDWRSKIVEKDIPWLAGKVRLMPLPAVVDAAGRPGRRTSTWGGTMIGITAKARHPDAAWQVVQYLYTDEEQLAANFGELNILPPFKDAWAQSAFHEPRKYWCNQKLGEEYIALADDVPAQYTSPYTEPAKSKMGQVVAACKQYYDQHGEDGFEAYARARLKQAADDVRKLMTRNPF